MPASDNLTPVGFRLPDSIIARIDAYSRHVEAKVPGVKLSRSNAIRALLELALTAQGFPGQQPKGKRGK
jgi:hypothetical protein